MPAGQRPLGAGLTSVTTGRDDNPDRWDQRNPHRPVFKALVAGERDPWRTPQ